MLDMGSGKLKKDMVLAELHDSLTNQGAVFLFGQA
jgi:hypothetical protein